MKRNVCFLFVGIFTMMLVVSCAKKYDQISTTTGKDTTKDGSTEGSSESGSPGTSSESISENDEAIIDKLDFSRIHFDYDQFSLTDTAKAVLDHHAELLKKYPRIKLKVVGHCDERGSNEYNLALGAKRAEEIKKYLVTLGIGENRLITESLGEEAPINTSKNEEAFALNRRGEFASNK